MSFASVRSATSRRVIAGPSSRRLLSTSGPVAAAKANKANSLAEANPNAMSVKEAVRVLRALEIANPSSAYSLEIRTKVKRGQTLRGRAALPTDPRRVTDTIVVFAPTDSPSAEAAKEAGANYVGDVDLFPKILSGEIVPTKVLSTPSMLPAVSKSLARFLGPKGLMPVTKRGTVGEGQELGRLIKAAGGTLDWKTDKEGYIRARELHGTSRTDDFSRCSRNFHS